MRLCFVPLTPEIVLAGRLLDAAADAFRIGRTSLAGRLIADADFPEITVFMKNIVGKMSYEVHRRTALAPSLAPALRTPDRMPSSATEMEVFRRDGWHCRFCGIQVVATDARKVLCHAFPDETHWASSSFERCHSALRAMTASLDHVVPHSRGGTNQVDNLVTACYSCQFGRGNFTLAEVELADPRERPPVVTTWDGLLRVLTR
jgi:5-methylcytosine-specific restriction endonuclease McrA